MSGADDLALSCKQCGARAVRPRTVPGRTVPYRNLGHVPIPDDFPILTCSRCRAETLDPETRKDLIEHLEDNYRAALRRRVSRAIDTLSQSISLRKLEFLLALSQGYLSRLRHGKGNPSPELVSNLASLAMDPKVRLDELRRYWEEPQLSDQVAAPAKQVSA